MVPLPPVMDPVPILAFGAGRAPLVWLNPDACRNTHATGHARLSPYALAVSRQRTQPVHERRLALSPVSPVYGHVHGRQSTRPTCLGHATRLWPSRRSLRPWRHPLLRLSRGSMVPVPFAHHAAPTPPHAPVLACTRSPPHHLRWPSHRPARSTWHDADVPRAIHHSAHAIQNSQQATCLSPFTGPAHSPNDARTDPRMHTPLALHRRRPRSLRPHQWPTRPVDPPPPAMAYVPPAMIHVPMVLAPPVWSMHPGLGPPAMFIHSLCYSPPGLTYGLCHIHGPHSTFGDARRTSYLDRPNPSCRSCR